MFGEKKIKELEKENKKLKEMIDYMQFEWNEERDLYTQEMWEKFYARKVDCVFGGIDITRHNPIKRPIINLTDM